MLHRTMTEPQAHHFSETACCPQCSFERLKRGINLKAGWWLCGPCETWWQLPGEAE